jgi:hypothetical protein
MLAHARPEARKDRRRGLLHPPPQARRSAEHAEAKTRSFPREYVEDIFGPRATQMPADRLPQ